MKKLYTKKDLEKAFNDGKSYGNDELELPTPSPSDEDTAFNRWFHLIFNNK